MTVRITMFFREEARERTFSMTIKIGGFLLQTKGSNLSRAMQWFGVNYTAVSHIVRKVKDKMKSGRDYRKKYALMHSQVKI
jgi:hypothetical protein